MCLKFQPNRMKNKTTLVTLCEMARTNAQPLICQSAASCWPKGVKKKIVHDARSRFTRTRVASIIKMDRGTGVEEEVNWREI